MLSNDSNCLIKQNTCLNNYASPSLPRPAPCPPPLTSIRLNVPYTCNSNHFMGGLKCPQFPPAKQLSEHQSVHVCLGRNPPPPPPQKKTKNTHIHNFPLPGTETWCQMRLLLNYSLLILSNPLEQKYKEQWMYTLTAVLKSQTKHINKGYSYSYALASGHSKYHLCNVKVLTPCKRLPLILLEANAYSKSRQSGKAKFCNMWSD